MPLKIRDFLEQVDAGTWTNLTRFIQEIERRVERDGETLGRVAEMLPAHRPTEQRPPSSRDLMADLRGSYEGVLRTLSTRLLTGVLNNPRDDASDGKVTVTDEVVTAAWHAVDVQRLEDGTGLRGPDLELARNATSQAFVSVIGDRGVTLDLGNGTVELRVPKVGGGGRRRRAAVGPEI